jgi:putative ABC transport system permease protein
MQDLLVVGVVADSTQGDLKNSHVNVLFSPALQSTAFNTPNLVLEIAGNPTPVAEAVRRTVLEHGREFVYDIAMVDELLARGPRRERMSAMLSSMIGAIAVLLAVIGIHGVLAYSVSRRTREIGVRVAIGANPSSVAMSVIREGAVLTVIGVVIGLIAASSGARVLRALLFGISETDLLTFVASAAFFAALGAVAGILPARRAAAIDPAITLRAE